jgi:hypothetical protein
MGGGGKEIVRLSADDVGEMPSSGEPMIAPHPATAAPRPTAGPREPARAAEPQERSGGDFDSVLAERPAGKDTEPAEGKAEAAPDGALAVGEPVVVLAVLTPAPVVEDAAALADSATPVDVAAIAGKVAAAAAPTLVASSFLPGEPELPPEAQPLERPSLDKEAPVADARVTGDPEAAAPEKLAAVPVPSKEMQKDVPLDRPLPAAPPALEAPSRETVAAAAPAVVARNSDPAAAIGDGGVQGIVLKDAAPPTWQLAAGPGLAPARTEAPVQVPALPPQAVMAQVAVAIGGTPDDRVELRLDPPELGRVQIHLTRLDGGIQAVVMADRPETHDLLRRHAEVLARELGSAGYDSVSLDFAAGHEEARAGLGEAREMDWAQVAPEVSAVPALPVPAPPRASLAGGLDIRL